MKDTHYDKIVDKAANMDLVKLYKNSVTGKWIECSNQEPVFSVKYEYFLCLPQHNESGQCLHWLNGGEVQFTHDHNHEQDWILLDGYDRDPKWYVDSDFMDSECRIRIKPKKEKRWVAYGTNSLKMGVRTFLTKEECVKQYGDEDLNGRVQYFEIEVEV